MERSFPAYLCLSDLLDQDLTAYEYFQTLSPRMQQRLRQSHPVRGAWIEMIPCRPVFHQLEALEPNG